MAGLQAELDALARPYVVHGAGLGIGREMSAGAAELAKTLGKKMVAQGRKTHGRVLKYRKQGEYGAKKFIKP